MKKILFVAAILLGCFAVYADSRPNFDDTGVLAFGILFSCTVFGLISPQRPWIWALCVGAWVPLYKIVVNQSFVPLLALVFAFAGSYFGAFLGSVFRQSLKQSDIVA